MSLLSQKDRKLVIDALEKYKESVPFTVVMESYDPLEMTIVPDKSKLMEINTLLTWIKLEYQKNDR